MKLQNWHLILFSDFTNVLDLAFLKAYTSRYFAMSGVKQAFPSKDSKAFR